MTIKLYQNLSESNVVDKNLTLLGEMTGTLRDGTSVLSPSIHIETDETIQAVNYIYIEEFQRYYFVGNHSVVINNLWQLDCRVDVLSTYKQQLRMSSGIVARQENNYNLYLEDNSLLTTSRRIYTTIAFPTRVNSASSNPDAPCFILTCAGGADSTPDESETTE